MKLFKLCAISCLILASASAEANWTGFYTGLNGGYGFGEQQTNLMYLPSGSGSTSPNTLSPSLDGGTFGGQIGIDWQLGQWFVLGLKYDMDWSGLSSATSSPTIDSLENHTIFPTSENLTWFGNLLPRLGFLPINHLFIYGTGGLAFGHINGMANQITTLQQFPGSINNTLAGWAAGAGAEWKMAQHWSLAAEYLYNELNNKSIIVSGTPDIPPYQNQYIFKTNFQLAELELNYHF